MGSPDMQNLFANRGMILQAKAFHRAVFDGRPDCLKELVRWAQNHNHDFTELRNVEELDSFFSEVSIDLYWACVLLRS